MADDEEGEEVFARDGFFPGWFSFLAPHRSLHATAEPHERAELGGRPDLGRAVTAFGEIFGAFVAEDILGDSGVFQCGVVRDFTRGSFVHGLFHGHRHIHRLCRHENGDQLLVGIDDGRRIHSAFATYLGANQRIFDAVGNIVSLAATVRHRHLHGAFKGLGRKKCGREKETGEKGGFENRFHLVNEMRVSNRGKFLSVLARILSIPAVCCMAIFGSIDVLRAQTEGRANFAPAFSYLDEVFQEGSEARARILAMTVGSVEKVDLGGGLFAMEQCYESKERYNWSESHRKYIDIQVIVAGEEFMEVANIEKLPVKEAYDESRDVIIYDDFSGTSVLRVGAGEGAVYFPEDGHMPNLRVGADPVLMRKVVVKVPV